MQTRYYDAKVGRFISPDSVGYLGANGDLNSYNLYAYCSNNPVMYADPSGHFVISLSALLIGVAIGAGVGAGMALVSTACKDYFDDGKIFNGSIGIDEYVGNIAGGFISGAGIGVCSVLGAGVGTAMIAGEGLVIGAISLSGAAAFGWGITSAFLAGGARYAVRTIINKKETFQNSDMFIEAGANTVSGAISFVGGMAGGMTGVYTPGMKNEIVNFAKYHGGLTYFGAYPSKFLISKIKNRLQELY